ncbi:phosphotransferase [Glutamicibacter mishrai]|uniref:phosphotransferase n=1 Tax=Glutamicibacter mishrai TaxID=1775880 RepID=UPI003F79AE38
MQIEYTQRITWGELPPELQQRVEQHLGSAVVSTQGQYGGFSPGSADRAVTADGQRVFIKAVDSEVSAPAAALHAKEAVIAANLPEFVPAPRFLGHISWEGWEALLFAEAPGRTPKLPWEARQLHQVLDTLVLMADRLPSELIELLPALEDELSDDIEGFGRIIADGFQPADAWVTQRLNRLHEIAVNSRDVLAGNAIVHSDLRSDNLLLGPKDEILLVDWPWASRGVKWYDAVTVLVEARLFDPALDVEALVAAHEIFASAQPGELTGVLAGLAAYYVDAARREPVSGLPTLRTYHAKQAAAVVGWLKERMD